MRDVEGEELPSVDDYIKKSREKFGGVSLTMLLLCQEVTDEIHGDTIVWREGGMALNGQEVVPLPLGLGLGSSFLGGQLLIAGFRLVTVELLFWWLLVDLLLAHLEINN